jgi:stage II sporulation protein M
LRTALFNSGKGNAAYLRGKLLLFVIILLMAGILAGSFAAFAPEEAEIREMSSFLSDFFSVYEKSSVPFWELFKTDFYGNFKYVAVFFFCGFSLIGGLLVAGMVLYKGFCMGYSTVMLLRVYGMEKLFGAILTVVLQNIIFVPLLIFLGAESILLSIDIFRLRKEKSPVTPPIREEILNFSAKIFLSVFFLLILSLADTLFLPLLIKLIRP